MSEQSATARRNTLVIAAVLLGFGAAILAAPLADPFTATSPGQRSTAMSADNGPAAPGSLADFFPIGVWVPPAADFAKWKARGVNTVVEVPQGNDLERWTAEARRLGLRMVRAPRTRPEDDRGEKLLLAWLLPDEPDLKRTPATTMHDLYRAMKAADAERPVLVNFSGGHVLNLQGNCDAACYRAYVAAADWVSSDIYPVTGWDRVESLDWVGRSVTKLRQLSGERPQFAFIETSDQQLRDGRGARGVMPSELRAEIWSAIISGARGIWYFAPSFNPFRFDATPADVVEELTRQNALITDLAPVLQGEINPASVGARVRAPLQVTWRSSAAAEYVIVLNTSDTLRTGQVITLDGIAAQHAALYGEDRTVPITAGFIRDDFGPHEVHVYRIDRPAAAGGR